ncbi:PhnD/SsuA/transferrin family substrate-binding protein [Caballeronia sp. dw_19]|uniref:ABC transporter substrate-binding protein n=1 Tax=Caballeronia sp. dw_19 TaxID=2719791 RepID=UPI001BD3B606|nr:PhnD/SsuA/transferrin family substrate-binding protein [Caballeronia sp. dw_19]
MNINKKGRFLRTLAAVVMTVAVFGVPAASGQTNTGKPDLSGVTITVGQQGTDTQYGFLASHLFDNTPYKLKFATFPSPSANLTALASGNVDIANNVSQWTATQAAAAASPLWTSATAPYKNILVTGPGNAKQFDRFVIAVSRMSGITDIKQSKGKRWGIIPGSSYSLFSAVVLKKLGWTAKDVTIVNLDATNQVLALETGQVDVLFNVTDNLPAALQHGAKIIGTANDYGLTIYTGFLANRKSLDDTLKGRAIEDFVRRMVAYQNWFVQHQAEAQTALVNGLHLTTAQAASVWKYARVVPVAPATISSYSQDLADLAFESGLIKQKVDATVLLDNRYANVIDGTAQQTNLLMNLKASYK